MTMAAPRVNGGRTRQGSESPLFCTPPTEETIGNLDNACDCYEENTKTGWPAATAATFGHTPMYYPTHTQVTQPVQKDDYQLFGSIRGGPSPTRIPDLYSQSSASQQWHYSQHALRSTTAPAGGSITSFSDPFEASPIQERNHLSSDKTGKSHLMTSISPSTTPSSITTSRPLQIFPSLGDLTGYVSSEKEEEERSPVQKS
ncbi:hypothetical protein EJ02DRAFT_74376 [Clathrospora elynae]|uniref:Uncharacterized protein n=1 Tax=Clathrospora elynae TaxID=706981 RepID=A0A6A5SB80_9PLEO|nr:hypothetical protein EJ02DRAFT_74376 [Clathrospora elynae]